MTRTRRRGNLPRVYQMHAGDGTVYFNIGSGDEPIYFDIDQGCDDEPGSAYATPRRPHEQAWENVGLDRWSGTASPRALPTLSRDSINCSSLFASFADCNNTSRK